MYFPSGEVLNCIRSQRPIGDLKHNSIHDILKHNTVTKNEMLKHRDGLGCNVCYDLEKGQRGKFDIISDRIFYIKELKEVPLDLYDSVDNFDLNKIDIRWSNACNHSCVYCGPEYSSKWAKELKIKVDEPSQERVEELKQYVFDNAHKLKHVYLAGGEPLLMKENEELLKLLLEVNPDVNVRVNTNLSRTGTPVFDLICQFKNVHWTVSIDEMDKEFEYIRYGGVWKEFLENLEVIRNLEHKVSFNMLHHILNYMSIFDCVEFLEGLGFHKNSFIIGPLTAPTFMDIRHLPNQVLEQVNDKLVEWIDEKPGFLLENSLKNMLQYIKKPMEKNIEHSLSQIEKIDKRRNIDSKKIFTNFYSTLERQ